MTKNKLVVLLLSLALLLSFSTMTFAKKVDTDTKVKINSVKNGHFETFRVEGKNHFETRAKTKAAMKQRLTKEELTTLSKNRSYLKSSDSEYIPLIQDVPGGEDIHSIFHHTFDTEDDFLLYTPTDLSADGAGNEWFWFDYIPYYGEDGIDLNSAFAPEPGNGYAEGDVRAMDEAIELKVGIPKESALGDPYRVATLILDLWLEETDPDDEFWVEIEEPAKWHLANEEWQMTSNQFSVPGYGSWWREDLRTPFIDLTAASGAVTLTFDQIYGMESGDWDGGNLWARTAEDAEWTLITPDGGYNDFVSAWVNSGLLEESPAGFAGETHDYETVTVDLSAYVGGMVQVRWAFASDGGYDAQDNGASDTWGWFVDNIDISDGSGSLFSNDGTEVGDMIALRLGPAETGSWDALSGWSGYAGDGVAANLDLTQNIIGAPGDSFGVRFRAIFDDNNDSGESEWGFEVSEAALEVYTRYATDIGVTFVDLDSTFSKNGFIKVGESYDPQVVVSNFGLSDVMIYNTFVKIINDFGSTVYERYLYTYAPGQGDTLKMFPGVQEFNEDQEFYNFADWTPEYQGNYTLIAYTDIFGGDDMVTDDSLVVDFHVNGQDPALIENFNTMTTTELYDNWDYVGANNKWEIDDKFGRGDTELWFLNADATPYDELILTPAIDCSNLSDVAVRLAHNIWDDGDETFEAKIVVTNDGGATLHDVHVVTADSPGSQMNGIFYYDISAYADGEANVQVGFSFKSDVQPAGDAGYQYFTVDDFMVFPDADHFDPGTPVNFAGTSGDMSAVLTWSGLETASFYSVLVADTNDVAVAEVAAQVTDSSATITGLENGTDYYLWVTSTDYNDNESAPSEGVMVTPADVTAPTQITDLHAADVNGETAKLLTWTAPFESAYEEGTTYEIRYAYQPITEAYWDNAMVLDEVPEVAEAGTEQSLTVPVDRLQDYYFDVYFAIKTTDEANNVSLMSNPAHADDILPGNVTDLSVVEVAEESITISWTAPGDDGVIAGGPVWAYELRVAYDSLGTEFTDWENAQVLAGLATPSAPGETEVFTATEYVYPSAASHTFGIVAIDWNGNVSEVIGMAYAPEYNSNVDAIDENALPETFALNQNYPNPFNPTTSISYQLPNNTHVKLEVFSTNGQKIRTLVNGSMPAGTHNIQWDAMDSRGMKVASGIYFYRLETSAFTSVKKMTLMK